jgi:hypothetical protein
VVDNREVAEDVEAVAAAKKYLSYFQGTTPSWEAADPLQLRDLIPENNRRRLQHANRH